MVTRLCQPKIGSSTSTGQGIIQKKGKLTVQADELWSFVDHKGNKQWVWLAIDKRTREMIGVHIGQRYCDAARKLWSSLPGVYRQCTVVYTDFGQVYEGVIPRTRHRAVAKETGKTSYIERLNNTLRQRVSRSEKLCLSLNPWKIT